MCRLLLLASTIRTAALPFGPSRSFVLGGHGRDPGIMIHGLIADMVGYQISVHNGEGSATLNADDDFFDGRRASFLFPRP